MADKLILVGLWVLFNMLAFLAVKYGPSWLAALTLLVWGPLLMAPLTMLDWWIKGIMGGEIYYHGRNHYKRRRNM